MSDTSDQLPAPRPADPAPHASAPSPRFVLAGLAHDAALTVRGVLGTDAGPGGTYVTAGGERRLTGVICAAVPGGAYDVSLSLVCSLVDLHALAGSVRTAVAAAAERSEVRIGRVDVHISQVEPEPAL